MTDNKIADDLRKEMLEVFAARARYWAELPNPDPVTGKEWNILDKCHGVVLSLLVELDGGGELGCAFDLVARVAEDDEDQSREGVVVGGMLHEHYKL